MNTKRNLLQFWCNRLFFGSLTTLAAILTLDYYFTLLPFNGIYLFVYLVTVSLVSVWVTFDCVQKLLQQPKPLTHDADNLLLASLKPFFTSTSGDAPLVGARTDLEERIQDFACDIEKYYVHRWYRYVTTDETFGAESRVLIADITRRFLQVVVSVDGKKLLHGIVVVFLRHLKEYRKALKRVRKNGSSIEDSYRYAHVGSKSVKAQEYFMHRLTTALLRQFINWELWNSLPCRTLVSVLARKLTNYLLIYCSKPGFVNYAILKAVARPERLNFNEFAYVSLSSLDGPPVETVRAETKKVARDVGNVTLTPKKPLRKAPDVVDTKEKLKPENTPKIEPTSTNAVSEPIQIHDARKVDRIWSDSSELESVSLGQDILTNLQDADDPNTCLRNFMDEKLWDDFDDSQEPLHTSEHAHGSPPLNIASAATLLTNTIKPIGAVTANTLHNMKELQLSTVNAMKPVSQATTTAMHKIGDLQDEAAGVMEGILDFGMAGIRKGLRLTGLQDDLNEGQVKLHKVVVKPKHATKLPKWQPVVAEASKVEDDNDDSVWVNPLENSSPSFDGPILLEKTPSGEAKEDSTDSDSKVLEIPQISTESPDPEYEEPADFATTIAKLRSLLQQKSSESTSTTPAVSPLPPDDSSSLCGKLPSDAEIDGVMPSIYKFCAKTATGVFQNTLNTIKTALPGNVPENVRAVYDAVDSWTYVTSDLSTSDLISRVEKLLSERREFCTVDTAYEAIDSLNIEDQVDEPWPPRPFDALDESDDLDGDVPVTRALVDVLCELVQDSDPWLVRESVVRALLLLGGRRSEEWFEETAAWFVRNVNTFVGRLPVNANRDVRAMKMGELVGICVEACPGYIRRILGDDTLNCASKLFLSSLQSQMINQDVCLQIFELVTFHVIQASGMATPAFSA